MKRCPECRRDYYDDTLSFCLDDGSALLDGPALADEPATALFQVPPAGDPALSQDSTRDTAERTMVMPQAPGTGHSTRSPVRPELMIGPEE